MISPSLALRDLSDDVLLVRLAEVLGRSRRIEAELIAHLAEVDARRLYLREACSSMHAYATERLHLSDAEAYLRITVARLSRRFPMVLSMLADGRLHLSGAARLAPHLDDQNGEHVLARAVHLSKRAIQELVAELAPQPDAPSLLRRLPGNTPSPARPHQDRHDETSTELRPGGAGGLAAKPSPSAQLKDRPAMPIPIAPARYKVQFTAGAELHDKLTRAQALLRREVPNGDLAVLVDRAVTLLLHDLERRAFARAASPRKDVARIDPTPSSRHVPDPIRRFVWSRDGGQCTFRDNRGRRCSARERLEFHHVIPFACGGDHSVGNIRLLCARHNAYQADLDFGSSFMAERRQCEGDRVAAPANTAGQPSGDRCGELSVPTYKPAATIFRLARDGRGGAGTRWTGRDDRRRRAAPGDDHPGPGQALDEQDATIEGERAASGNRRSRDLVDDGAKQRPSDGPSDGEVRWPRQRTRRPRQWPMPRVPLAEPSTRQ